MKCNILPSTLVCSWPWVYGKHLAHCFYLQNVNDTKVEHNVLGRVGALWKGSRAGHHVAAQLHMGVPKLMRKLVRCALAQQCPAVHASCHKNLLNLLAQWHLLNIYQPKG